MMNSVVIDIAECILTEMVAFKEKSPMRANLPFVAMVSSLCASIGVPFTNDGLLLLLIGPITLASVKKSTTMSRTPAKTPTKGVDIASTSKAPPKPK